MFYVQLAPLGGILGQNTPFERLIVFNVKTQKTRFLKKPPIKLADFWYMKSFWCPPSPCQILQMGVSRVDLLVQRRGAWSAWAVSCNASIYFKILYILECFPMEGLFSHDCKGANKSSRTKWHLYIQHGQIFTQKENESLMVVFLRYSTVRWKVHGPTGKKSKLKESYIKKWRSYIKFWKSFFLHYYSVVQFI